MFGQEVDYMISVHQSCGRESVILSDVAMPANRIIRASRKPFRQTRNNESVRPLARYRLDQNYEIDRVTRNSRGKNGALRVYRRFFRTRKAAHKE